MNGALSGAETLAAGALALFATPILAAYLLDLAGIRFLPIIVLPLAAAATALVFVPLARNASWRAAEAWAFAGVFVVVFAWLMWFAHGGIFPPGRGSDLTHHLMLIDYIESHWHFPNEPDAEASLGVMAPYTPGLHVLASLAGSLSRTDGLHTVYAVIAASVALKAGLIFLIAFRLFRSLPLALTGVALFFVPREYALGSFTLFSFFPQVLAELFAVAMWWALALWADGVGTPAMALFALSGAAAFLTWPVLLGPLAIAAAAVGLLGSELPWRRRITQLSIAGVPIAIVAALYIFSHGHWLGLVRTGGAVIWPTTAQYGWWFLALTAAGLPVLLVAPSGRVTLFVAAGVAVQTAVLWRIAVSSGADTPYLALKMLYFAVGIEAICATGALAYVCRRLAVPALSWVLAAAVFYFAGRPLVAARRPVSLISEPVYQAGVWARDHVPRTCVEYLVGDDGTAYWLHLAVLRNQWRAPRTGVDATYHPQDAIIRWLTPGGLPDAIADLRTLPADVRRELNVIADFGDAVVAERRGPGVCDRSEPTR